MLGDVFNEKKRIYMAFFAVRRASAPSEATFKFFFYYKSLHIRVYKTQYTFIKINTHHVCDPSYYKYPTRIVLSVARCSYETIVGESCDSRTTNLTIIARFIVRVIFVKKAPGRPP